MESCSYLASLTSLVSHQALQIENWSSRSRHIYHVINEVLNVIILSPLVHTPKFWWCSFTVIDIYIIKIYVPYQMCKVLAFFDSNIIPSILCNHAPKIQTLMVAIFPFLFCSIFPIVFPRKNSQCLQKNCGFLFLI